MIYSALIKKAILFSINTHEVYQKQKRKGKDIPYIIHPLIVGMLLSRAGSDEEVVAAGILHDTIEDSLIFKKVTRGMLADRFGERVADIVDSVTERPDKKTWDERKQDAITHIVDFSHASLMVKAADVLANGNEILSDHRRLGDKVFDRFGAPKEKIMWYYTTTAQTLLKKWRLTPFAMDLKVLIGEFKKIK